MSFRPIDGQRKTSAFHRHLSFSLSLSLSLISLSLSLPTHHSVVNDNEGADPAQHQVLQRLGRGGAGPQHGDGRLAERLLAVRAPDAELAVVALGGGRTRGGLRLRRCCCGHGEEAERKEKRVRERVSLDALLLDLQRKKVKETRSATAEREKKHKKL